RDDLVDRLGVEGGMAGTEEVLAHGVFDRGAGHGVDGRGEELEGEGKSAEEDDGASVNVEQRDREEGNHREEVAGTEGGAAVPAVEGGDGEEKDRDDRGDHRQLAAFYPEGAEEREDEDGGDEEEAAVFAECQTPERVERG